MALWQDRESFPRGRLTCERIQREAIDRDRGRTGGYGPKSIEAWPGQCQFVAPSVIRNGLVGGRQSNGAWCGPVTGPHRDRFCTTEVAMRRVRHVWITLADGRVCDPTRWVFEGVEPYVYVGTDAEHYYVEQHA
jgi:hypothetical protein